MEDKDKEVDGPIIQARHRGRSQGLVGDADLDVTSESVNDVGPAKDDSLIYQMPRGLITVE